MTRNQFGVARSQDRSRTAVRTTWGTGRHRLLFEESLVFTDATRPGHGQWVDYLTWALLHSVLWPDDHSRVLGTEIDFTSIPVAGITALIRELGRTLGPNYRPSLGLSPYSLSAPGRSRLLTVQTAPVPRISLIPRTIVL